ncbi:sugar ABC transporter ATP-binding protein [Herbiconiux sp. KACC 21604]|uniref:sugar ABC transporter ATP-binding protein n=1 Tax=unclassified Herbiconiux TaxID=2618217 RepID=UPI001492AE94|nr:sugar ABC transporter ATP-binding protein [Herbiconiux sp. SALV-R1]QJU52762.1 sugar ABC transporter ATP-binding protein [Herbiconiux sp. SALV-R1]WPO87666.1 sugar ABC transporter ATP-binding protein [Herbiconiux sp. KACC 21604]
MRGGTIELELDGITKGYLGVQALKGVTFSVTKGSIHALAGQNGAGKSTLVKMLSGAETPDGGTIRLGGKDMRFREPTDAQNAGIHTIYQELSLVPSLSVAENIFLGRLPRQAGKVDWARMYREAQDALARVGFDLDVRAPVGSFSTAEQQAVELAKALHKDARVLLLDEPTSTLPSPDVEKLFTVLRSLAAEGVTLLFISHRMDEVYSLCDAVTVLRDGATAAEFDTADSTPSDVVTAMVGKSLEGSIAETALRGERSPRLGTGRGEEVILSVDRLSDEGHVDDVSFELRRGEVLGMSGLIGSGQSELAGLLAGARRRASGSIRIDGKRVDLAAPRDAIRRGIGLLPQDRKTAGFVPDLGVAANITLASLPAFSRLSVIDSRRERRVAADMVTRLGMKVSGVNQPVKTLSGGTQQKAILARWLVRKSRILICDEPTRGVDVGAKEDMYELLRDYARGGGTVIIASSEITEAMMCDRVLVMARGSVVAELNHDEIDPQGKAILSRFA